MVRQLCNDAHHSVLIENNGLAPDWGCNAFSSNCIVFKENRIASIITELFSVAADAWCRRVPTVQAMFNLLTNNQFQVFLFTSSQNEEIVRPESRSLVRQTHRRKQPGTFQPSPRFRGNFDSIDQNSRFR